MDSTDHLILKAIADLRLAAPRADQIAARVKLDGEELEARLGILEMEGYVKTRSGEDIPGVTLPGGIFAASITDRGRKALSGNRWL